MQKVAFGKAGKVRFKGKRGLHSLEGVPYQKPEQTIGNETIGLDIGPSTIAMVGDAQAE